MKRVLIWCFKASAATIMSAVILSLFTLFYSHTGVHITNESGATDYKWEAGQYRANMTEGFSWLQMNDDGFNNAFGLKEVDHIDVLLMGSSHVEAVNVAQDKNCAYLLNEVLRNKITYNIGTSGHTIYQCVKNLSDAVECYNPSEYVIIETDCAKLDEVEMRQVLDGTLPDIPSHDKGLKYKVQKYIPCFLPLYRELSNWVRVGTEKPAITAEAEVIATGSSSMDSDGYVDTLDSFVEQIAESVGNRRAIVVYHPNTKIDENGLMVKPDARPIDAMAAACEKHGIIFVNMYDDFALAYETKNVIAHGFINTAIGSGHLNEIGHWLMAERLSAVIKEQGYGAE